jgi:hypothetical protein
MDNAHPTDSNIFFQKSNLIPTYKFFRLYFNLASLLYSIFVLRQAKCYYSTFINFTLAWKLTIIYL